VKTYRWLFAGSLVVSASWFAGACGGSSDDGGGQATGGKGNRGGTGGSANASGSSSGGVGASVGGSGGSGVSGDSGAGPGGEGGEQGETCASTTQVAELAQANLLFVVDKSGSMECNPPEGNDALNAMCANFPRREDPRLPSKWEVTIEALQNALDSLAAQPNVQAGLMVFPVPERAPSSFTGKRKACYVDGEADVPVGGLDAQGRADIGSTLDAVVPEGETPIVGATVLGYKYLSDEIRAGNIEGNHFVVLLTDGAETCEPGQLSELVNQHVPNARLWNIRTFVIGAPGSEEARSLLSQIAWDGGTASSTTCSHGSTRADRGDCHFDMTESSDLAADLNAALQEISRTTVLSCEYNVPQGEDVDFNKVNVTFTPGGGEKETIFKVEGDCSTADGWQYSPDGSKIVLCGDVCDRVKADSEGQVRIVLGCETVVR
jgi:hypothetical protein